MQTMKIKNIENTCLINDFMDLIDNPVMVFDLNGNLIHFNESCTNVLSIDNKTSDEITWPSIITETNVSLKISELLRHFDPARLPATITFTPKGYNRPVEWMNRICNHDSSSELSILTIAVHTNRPMQDDLYEQIFEKNPDIQLLIDPTDGHIVVVSDAAVKFYGYPRNVLTNMSIQNINTLPTPQVKQEMQKALTGEKHTFLFKHRLASGEIRDVEANVTAVTHRGKMLLHSSITDITEQENARAQVRLLTRAVDQSVSGIVITDLKGDIQYANPSFIKMTGYTLEELTGENPRILKSGEMPAETYKAMWDNITQGQNWSGEFTNINKAGKKYYTRNTLSPVKDENQNITHYIGIAENITEWKHFEHALKDSEERFRSLVNSMDDIVFLLDTEQRHVAVYGQWLKKNNIPPEMFLGRTSIEILGEEMGQIHAEKNALTLQGEHVIYEWVSQMADGIHHIQTSLSPVYDAYGNITGIAGVGRDITPLKEMEKALRESERLYRILISSMAEGILVQNQEGEIITCNEAACSILGLKHRQITAKDSGKLIWNAIHADGSPFPIEEHPAKITLQTGIGQHNVVMGIKTSDDQITWISMNCEPLFEEGIEKTVAVVASFTDITAQVQAQRNILEHQQRLEMALNGAELGTWDFYIRENKNVTNERWSTMLGYEPGEVDSIFHSWNDLVHPEDRQNVNQAMNAHIRGETQRYEAEFRMKAKSGEWLWIQSHGKIVEYNANGKPVRFSGTHLDITERKEAQRRTVELAVEKARVNVISDFIRDASHEFRTPLSIIESSAYIISRYEGLSEKHLQHVERIRAATKDILKLVENLVMMSYLDAHPSLKLSSVNVNDILINVGHRYRSEYEMKSIEVVQKFGEKIITMKLDIDLMIAAFSHLFENAIKFTPNDGRITLSTEIRGNHLWVTFEDTGIGITEDNIQKIFSRFYRADDAHSTRGFGLGLPIASRIVELHEGSISVTSERGKGSRFVIKLPCNSM